MKKLKEQLDELESYFDLKDQNNEAMSKANIGWHLDHSLQVVNGIARRLEYSEIGDYKYSFSLLRTVLLFLGILPRGKAKSPKTVTPVSDTKQEDLERRIGYARENIEKLDDLSPKNNFTHPYFGQLNLKQSIRFLNVHTEHHLKIIRDILQH